MAIACSFRPEQTAHGSIHRTVLRSARVSSIVSGHARFTRLLGFIFFAILIVDGCRERRYSVRIRWCCTHRPPRSVTDAEEPLIVTLRASINSYLERAGKRSAMRTSIISLDPQTIAYRARHSRATRRSVTAWLVIVRTAPPAVECRLNTSIRSDR